MRSKYLHLPTPFTVLMYTLGNKTSGVQIIGRHIYQFADLLKRKKGKKKKLEHLAILLIVHGLD
jgi:hypothetical protein